MRNILAVNQVVVTCLVTPHEAKNSVYAIFMRMWAAPAHALNFMAAADNAAAWLYGRKKHNGRTASAG